MWINQVSENRFVRVILLLVLMWFGKGQAEASMPDPEAVLKNTRITRFECKDADLLDCVNQLWEACLAKDFVQKREDYASQDSLINELRFFVVQPHQQRPKASVSLQNCSAQEVIEKIAKTYGVKLYRKSWFVGFSSKELKAETIQGIDESVVYRPLGVAFARPIIWCELDFSDQRWIEFLNQSFRAHTLYRDVVFQRSEPPPGEQKYSMSIFGQWWLCDVVTVYKDVFELDCRVKTTTKVEFSPKEAREPTTRE